MKKGFTLIELLAVIVILSVIALISVPLILGVIEDSKVGAFKDSVSLTFSSAELYEAQNSIPVNGIEVKNLVMKNNNFKYGKIIKNANNELVAVNIGDGNYCANGVLTNLTINKGECDSSIPTCTYEIISGTKGLNDWYITSPTIEFKTSKSDVSGIYYGVGIDENYESTILNNNESKTLTSTITTSVNTTTIYGYVKSGSGKKNTCSVTFKTDLISPLSPEVSGTNAVWTTSKILTLTEPLNKSGILKYEYYISDSSTKPLDNVAITGFTNSLVNEITTSGKYIYFRTVNNAGVTGSWSDAKDLYVDSENAIINISVSGKIGTINLSDNYGLTSYALTATNVVPTSWTTITGTSSVQSYTATVSGTYYVWTKDIAQGVSSNSFIITPSAFWVDLVGQKASYNYTGSSQTFTAPATGYYKLETWGAAGGNGNTYIGGYGGYSIGVYHMNIGEKIYIYVGGFGQSNCTSTICIGGYNGGGQSFINLSSYPTSTIYQGGGGGATHISTVNSLLKDLSTNKSAILIVSGAGGGGSMNGTTWYGAGGQGGGISGTNATYGGLSGNSTYPGLGGTQIAGGLGLNCGAGNFGLGSGTTDNGAGGGGGYYGGGCGWGAGGGGGSGYIGGVITYGGITTSTVAGNTSFKSPTGTTEVGHQGNGNAAITFIAVG